MVEKQHAKILNNFSDKKGKTRFYIMIFFSVLLIALALLNIIQAIKVGTQGGYNIKLLFEGWLNGYEAQSNYSGIYLLAIERLEIAILELCLSIIMAIGAIKYHSFINFSSSIIEILKYHKEWPE